MRKIAAFFRENKKWNIALWSGICIFLVFSLMAVNSREDNIRIKKIRVRIEPEAELSFLDSNKVLDIIKNGNPNNIIISARRNNLSLDLMESALERNPFVEKADISADLSGRLIIRIEQRSPVLRVFNKFGQTYYVAKNGFKMPVHESFAPRVLAASGNIAASLSDTSIGNRHLIDDLLAIATYCGQDEFWHSQIEQLYVDNYMDIILIPKVGNHSIVFGSADNLEKKFTQLKLFYFKGLNNVGWDKYKTIILKYDGQIVAEKKNTVTQEQNQQ